MTYVKKTLVSVVKLMGILGIVTVFLVSYLFMTKVANAQQDQVVVDGGLGALGTKGDSLPQVKFAKVGVEEDLWYSLKQRFNVGEWLDSRGSDYSNSSFAGYQLGFEVKNDVLECSLFSGPSLITSPDNALGGILQFNETLFLGVVDKNDETIGVAYNHFSSAGLYTPNLGRDFLGLEIKFPF
jgi:hypothetical protein